MADSKDVGVGKEFPTDWHKEAYVANLKRELEGATVRGDEDYQANVKAELARFEKKEHAPKAEPAGKRSGK